MHTVYKGNDECIQRDLLERSEDRVACSVQQPGQIDIASWISLGYFCTFWSELAAGRRGWNTVCLAEWSSEGDPSRKPGRLFRGNMMEGESAL